MGGGDVLFEHERLGKPSKVYPSRTFITAVCFPYIEILHVSYRKKHTTAFIQVYDTHTHMQHKQHTKVLKHAKC